MSSDLSLITKPVSDLGICLLNKLENAGAYIFPAKDIRDKKGKACKSIIDEVATRKDINPVERLAIISNYKKIVKEYMNQTDIVQTAMSLLSNDAIPEKIEDDWIQQFCDKAKFVSDDDMKVIWGKVLAEEANEPGSISKQLLHILSIMDKKNAEAFMNLVPFCFIFDYKNKQEPCAIIFYSTNQDYYLLHHVYFLDILALGGLGLLTYNFDKDFLFTFKQDSFRFNYNNKNILVKPDGVNHETKVGNLKLSNEGMKLYNICEKKYSKDIYEFTLNTLKQKNKLIIEEI